MSPFFLLASICLATAIVMQASRVLHPLDSLKICTILAVLSGLAYNPNSAFVPAGAFSTFFGRTDIVRAMSVFVMLALLFSPGLPRVPYKHKVIIVVSAFPLFMGIISALTGEPAFTKGIAGFALRMTDIVCFFSFGLWLGLRKNSNDFTRFMLLLALIVAGLNIAAVIFDPSSSIRAERFRGVSFSVNWAGIYLALLIVPVFATVLSAKSWFSRSLVMPILVALLVFLLSSGSRGAIASGLAGIIALLFTTRVSKLVSGLVAAVVILTITFLPENRSLASMSGAVDRFSTAHNTRESVWQDGWQSWLNSGQIWFGSLDTSNAVESQFLSTLFVYGVIGTIVLSLCLAALVFQITVAVRGRPSTTSGVATSIVVVFLFSCLFEAPFFGIISAFNIFLLISIGAIFGDKASRQQQIGFRT